MKKKPFAFSRESRIADQMAKDLAVWLQQEASLLELPVQLSLTHVYIAPRFAYADIFISCDENKADEIVKALTTRRHSAVKYLCDLKCLRSIPPIRFKFDKLLVESNKMMSLIDQAMNKTATTVDEE